MKDKKKYRLKVIITIEVMIFVIFILMGSVYAYLATFASIEGTIAINIEKPNSKLHQEVNGNLKNISIENTGNMAIYARVKVFAPSKVKVIVSSKSNNDKLKWKQEEDGYWYYNNVILPGQTTEILEINVDNNKFSPIVISETAIALYNDNGMLYANW